jgi:Ca-activated chloride channel family protein
MNLKITGFVLAIVAGVLFFGAPVRGQGVIIPIICDIRPCRPRPLPRPVPLPNVLPVKSIQLDTKISGQVATTRVVQVFRNDTPHTLEGTYFFPIPENASIVEFSIWENGKKLTGEVRTREEARRIYDEIVRRQRDPGLLEYAGKDLFQASIFPIPGNSDKKLELVYSQVLKAESGTVAYKYPLGTGRNLWQAHGADIVRTGHPMQKFGTVSGKVEISSREALRNVYSPSHKIEVSNKGERAATVSFETSDNDSDFQLFYGVSNDDFGMTILTHREPGKDGYFLLMVSPRDDVAERATVNKDIVFVLDTSGSMADEGKMEKARAALLFGIRSLRDGDRFNVINFAGEEHLMERRLIVADAGGRRRGEEFVKTLRPTGGTNINDTLVASMKQFEKNDRPKMLVFMTDGLPTVGETSVDRINANLQKAKMADVRVFPFGFGYDVNTTLLDKLGSENSGMSDYVQPKEDLEIKVSNFFARVSSPVLSDVDLDFGTVDVDLMYPRKLTDIFKGMQLVVIGRYKNVADLSSVTLSLRGKSALESRSFNYSDLAFPARENENDFLPRLWASRRVGWLIEQIRLNGETKELKDDIVDLGTRYGIVTPYTSYLATDGSFANVAPTDARQLSLLSAGASAKMKRESGADAVQQSVQQNSMQSNITAAPAARGKDLDEQILIRNTTQNQFVANKNFVNQGDVWVDVEYKPELKQTEVELSFASDEYFAVLERERELAQWFALGESVIVVWKNKVYRVRR